MTSIHQERPDPVSDHLDLAALHVYELSKPAGGLPWDLLTSGQRERYRLLVKLAARMTDVTAMRAALERGASGLAVHVGLSLKDCSGPLRRSMRFQAMDCIHAFEYQLTSGDAALDALTLSLQDEERRVHVNELHARAILEDEAETVKRQARWDLETVTGEGRY